MYECMRINAQQNDKETFLMAATDNEKCKFTCKSQNKITQINDISSVKIDV